LVFVRWWQELANRARGRYDALDRMSSELRRLQEQRDALYALIKALRTEDGWLAYRTEALQGQLLELEGQPTEGVSAVEAVCTALVDRDEALQRARQDLEEAHAVAAEWEAEVVFAHAQLQRDRAALEGARVWQSQAKERAKEAKELRASLVDKAAAVVTAEEKLRQERVPCQEAEGQLQQERAALVEARATLERERLAQQEALRQLQQERAALEGARAALKQWEDEASKLNGELVQLSILHEDLLQSLEEQEATVRDLRREVEEVRKALEVEKKQVEGELVSSAFLLVDFPFEDSLPTFFFFVCGFQACGLPWGTRPPRPRQCRRPTTPLNRSWRCCRSPPSRSAKRWRRAWRRPGVRWRVICTPSGGMSPRACSTPFTWASRRPSAWWRPTIRWTSRPCAQAMLSQSAS
jgi:chromosome segregation ATPase